MISIIVLPVIFGIVILAMGKRNQPLQGKIAFLGALINLLMALSIFGKEIVYTVPWAGFGMEFSLRAYHFSTFIVAAAAGFGILVALYSLVFMKERSFINQFFGYMMISLGLVNGAAFANNLIVMLFFWEGLLATLFGMIAIGNKGAFKTATKAFIIVGVSDLCMMAGIAITAYLSRTLTMTDIHLTLNGLGGVAFVLLMIGAIAKAGSMPFHSWIPNAAIDAPLPFMAFLPAALEKLLGIYFLARITLDLFKLEPHTWGSYLLMTIGAITILLAVMMALIQKDYKKLLSYHAISQVGYMVLGIGTAVPVGIVGGLFHMINHAMYKSCLFLTGGAVEKQAGTTNLKKLGGLGLKMPVTFGCFIIAAASISGVPPFNGFFSKELIYDGALERGNIFYIAAVLGSFLTAASFLKLGHAAFLGKREAGAASEVKEAPAAMLFPMIVIAGLCVLFGVANFLPLNYLIEPILGESRLEGHHFSGFPTNMMLVVMTFVALIAALINHIYGVKKTGSGIGAVDHIHHAPGLSSAYNAAEKGFFDPYNAGKFITRIFAFIMWGCDRFNDWIYNVLLVQIGLLFTGIIRALHNGNYKFYILWSVVGAVMVIWVVFAHCGM